MSLNAELSDVFRQMAAILEIKGENVFKAIALSKVSRILKDMAFDVREAVENGTLKDIEGIGASSQKVIVEYVKTGRSTDYDELSASVPPGLLTMMEIPGLGPKTIALLWKERGVTSLDELVKAIDSGALAGLKGIGDKKILAIKEGIALHAQAGQRLGIVEALPLAESLLARLRGLKPVKQAEVAGSLRRRKETIGDVDFVCALADGHDAVDGAGAEVTEAFTRFSEVQKILGQGPTKASVLTAGGLQVDLRIVPAENFGAALLYFTGSKDHNVKLRGWALDAGLTLNEWGLYDLAEYEKVEKAGKRKPGYPPPLKPVASKKEEDVYKKLRAAWVPPELREDRGELDAARAGKLPKLIEVADVRCDLHTHTTASDGVASIEQMAEAAIAKGYSVLAITDHSKSQTIANGLTAERLMKHVAAIRKVAEKVKRSGLTLLAGSEVDILADGRLDYEDAVLAELDIVVASPHIALKQDEAKATDRIVRAIENRYVTLIGHPTGRLINARAGLPLRFDRVFKAAAATGTALEINAGYPRFDIDDVHARAAVAAGVKISVNTDAHATEELDAMVYGVNVARRGWLTAADVINCMEPEALLKFIRAKRGR